ncbi:MAG: hypothetical protein K1X53_12125, partial [Candidatus Sumerlaeaceae bacterium]|nr:hypothetical protein [Candidatus Sumerlaeaceae bacterium]
PRSIECVDISNIMGTLAVGSLVRFDDARRIENGYRRFRIKTVEGSNDFAMMREVLSRRFRPAEDRDINPPDLLLVDGGKGQLGIAEQVFKELNVQGVALGSIAKSRLKVRAPKGAKPGAGSTDVERFRTEERIFLPNRKNPVTFPHNSPALFLVERVRDEAHRFAITYHKKLRSVANRRGILDEIPGVGPRRKRQLLRHFCSLAALRAASEEEIAAVEGVGPAAAKEIHRFLAAPVAAIQTEMFEDPTPDDETATGEEQIEYRPAPQGGEGGGGGTP